METPTYEADNDAEIERVAVDYIKSNQFRTVAANGVLASLTPQGQMQLALFTERQAIPQRVVYKLDKAGQLGDIDEVIGRDSIVREVEVLLSLDMETAQIVHNAIRDLIKQIEADKNNGEKK